MVSRGFGFYLSIITMIYMVIAITLQIGSTSSNRLFAVTVIYMITVSEGIQWFLRQIITTESFMVSAERILQMKDLETEQ